MTKPGRKREKPAAKRYKAENRREANKLRKRVQRETWVAKRAEKRGGRGREG